jgi:hypothetical protein
MNHQLPRSDVPCVDQTGNDVGEHIIGNRQQHQIGSVDDIGEGTHGGFGEQRFGSDSGQVGDAVRRDNPVAGPVQSRTEDRTGAARADDAYSESRRRLTGAHGLHGRSA